MEKTPSGLLTRHKQKAGIFGKSKIVMEDDEMQHI